MPCERFREDEGRADGVEDETGSLERGEDDERESGNLDRGAEDVGDYEQEDSDLVSLASRQWARVQLCVVCTCHRRRRCGGRLLTCGRSSSSRCDFRCSVNPKLWMEVEMTPTQTPMVIWAPEERSPRPMEAVAEGVGAGEVRVRVRVVECLGVRAGGRRV